MANEEDKPYCTNLRVPPILAARMKDAAEKRNAEGSKISINDWIVEAIRRKLDGPPLVKASELPRPTPPPVVPATRPLSAPGRNPPPPPDTYGWNARFTRWASRDQAGALERHEFLLEAGVPADILSRPADKILTWLRYKMPNGPEAPEAAKDESGW